MAKKSRGGKEGTPELCRPGSMPPGSAELHRGGGPPDNPELFRRGSIAPTMPELGGMFRPQNFVDRIKENERKKEDSYETGLVAGHKRMAGMP